MNKCLNVKTVSWQCTPAHHTTHATFAMIPPTLWLPTFSHIVHSWQASFLTTCLMASTTDSSLWLVRYVSKTRYKYSMYASTIQTIPEREYFFGQDGWDYGNCIRRLHTFPIQRRHSRTTPGYAEFTVDIVCVYSCRMYAMFVRTIIWPWTTRACVLKRLRPRFCRDFSCHTRSHRLLFRHSWKKGFQLLCQKMNERIRYSNELRLRSACVKHTSTHRCSHRFLNDAFLRNSTIFHMDARIHSAEDG